MLKGGSTDLKNHSSLKVKDLFPDNVHVNYHKLLLGDTYIYLNLTFWGNCRITYSMDDKTTDAELIRACHRDDRGAFRHLVVRHQSTAYGYALRLTAHSMDAEDLVQLSFMRIWKYRQHLRAEARFTTLLYTITTRLWIDQLRSRKRRPVTRALNEGDENAIDSGDNPEQQVINQDVVQRIKSLVGKLPYKQRLVFTLRDLEELSIKEVVAITGMSAGSVKTNLSLARKRIRKRVIV